MGARRKSRRARKKGRAKRIARVKQIMADKAAEELRMEDLQDRWENGWYAVTGRTSANKPNIQQLPRKP